MRRTVSNWAIVGGGLLAAAAFIGYGSYKLVNTRPATIEVIAPLAPTSDVPVASYVISKAPILRGSRIEQDALETISISGSAPDGATNAVASLVGKFAVANIPAHQLVLSSLVTADPQRAGLSFTIAPGYRAMTIRTNDEIAVGNFIRVGDRLDIALVLHNNVLPKQTDAQQQANGDPSESHTVLQSVEVLAVGDTLDDPNAPDQAKGQPAATNARRPEPPKSITVAMTPDQISQFVLARSLGSFYFTLRNPTDPQIVTSDPAALRDIRGHTPPPSTPVAQADRPIELITGNRTQVIYSQSRGAR